MSITLKDLTELAENVFKKFEQALKDNNYVIEAECRSQFVLIVEAAEDLAAGRPIEA